MSIYKYYSKDDALDVLKKYCVYQDRCHSEVRTRLLKLKIYGDDLEDIIVELIQDDYLNEERFARSYVRGRYRIKSWGRYKIERGLKEKRVSEYCIRKGMTEILEEEYLENLERMLLKRANIRPSTNERLLNIELMKFAQSKGYKYDEAKDIIGEITREKYPK